jgi:GNAT superfamily N-acetyltransferase
MNINIRLLKENDLDTADRIFRLAFGTFNNLPNPLAYGGDSDKVRSRWRAEPTAALGAEIDGELVASNFLARWGSVAYFGPLTVHPDWWDRGLAQKLLEPTLAQFHTWGCPHTGLYTYANSPKHLSLYQKFGFYPRYLTAIMSREVQPLDPDPETSFYSAASPNDRPGLVQACAGLTDSIYAGLDVSREIHALADQQLGDALLLWDEPGLVGFAAIHCGPGSEAGSACCYIKFGAARPGPKAANYFHRLLTAAAAYAASQGVDWLLAGVNLSRRAAYQQLLSHGFKIDMVGVTMHQPNEPAYHRSDAYVIDDWR